MIYFLTAAVVTALDTQVTFDGVAEHLMRGGGHYAIQPALDKAVENFTDFDKLNLPPTVQTILHDKMAAGADGDVQLAPESIAKARKILNKLVFEAQKELDDKTIECKEFIMQKERIIDIINTDLANLATVVTFAEGLQTQANSGKETAIVGIDENKFRLEQEEAAFETQLLKDEAEMTAKRNDLMVGEFILKLTKCPKEGGFLQTGVNMLRECTDKNGKHTTRFHDDHVHSAMLKMHSSTRTAFEQTLQHAANLSISKESPPEESATSEAATGTSKPASESKQANKCTLGKPNCGLLHDNMSLTWGEMKDEVDKLNKKMVRRRTRWEDLKANLEGQIKTQKKTQEQHESDLAEASKLMSEDMDEQQRKEKEKRGEEELLFKKKASCKTVIEEILFTKICGVIKVRNEIHPKEGEVTPNDIEDCVVGDWVVGDCSVSCDDTLKGGWQVLSREVIMPNNEFGIECPKDEDLDRKIRCGRHECPIDCKLDPWSGFSACTKDCGGGIRARSRSRAHGAKFGGMPCDKLAEQEECNAQSCDKNCRLKRWNIRPCSVACGGGWMIRKRHVRKPAKGNGKCPHEYSKWRYGKRRCNRHPCHGDEDCVAKQDVVVAIDGSGSMTQVGFDVLKMFAAKVVGRFRGTVEEQDPNGWLTFHGEPFDEAGGEEPAPEPEIVPVPASQVGLVQFGQGELLEGEDGRMTVSPAVIKEVNGIKGMTTEIEKVVEAINGLEWMRGFTNMAQAFQAADTMYQNGGRKNAQSVLMVFTDGKPSFKFQTFASVKRLRREGVKVMIIAVKSFLKPKEKDMLRSWVSKPSATNFMHIEGLKELSMNMPEYVTSTVIHGCPKTVSVTAEQAAQEALDHQNELANLKHTDS